MSSRLCISFTLVALATVITSWRPTAASTIAIHEHVRHCLSCPSINTVGCLRPDRRRLRNRLRRLRNWRGAAAGLRNQTPCVRPVFLTPGGYCKGTKPNGMSDCSVMLTLSSMHGSQWIRDRFATSSQTDSRRIRENVGTIRNKFARMRRQVCNRFAIMRRLVRNQFATDSQLIRNNSPNIPPYAAHMTRYAQLHTRWRASQRRKAMSLIHVFITMTARPASTPWREFSALGQ